MEKEYKTSNVLGKDVFFDNFKTLFQRFEVQYNNNNNHTYANFAIRWEKIWFIKLQGATCHRFLTLSRAQESPPYCHFLYVTETYGKISVLQSMGDNSMNSKLVAVVLSKNPSNV